MISLAVAAAGWVGGCSPGDYAAFKFPPTPRHDPQLTLIFLLLYLANPRETIIEQHRFSDITYAKAELSGLLKPEIYSIVAAFLREARRTQITSFAALGGIAFIILAAVFFALAAGRITEVDRGGAANIETLKRNIVANRQEQIEAIQGMIDLDEQRYSEEILGQGNPQHPVSNTAGSISGTPGLTNEGQAGASDTASGDPFANAFEDAYGSQKLAEFEKLRRSYETLLQEESQLTEILNSIREQYYMQSVSSDDNATTQSLISSQITRFGVILVLLFFAQALINLYRYTLRLSAVYKSKALILALSDGDTKELEVLRSTLSVETERWSCFFDQNAAQLRWIRVSHQAAIFMGSVLLAWTSSGVNMPWVEWGRSAL